MYTEIGVLDKTILYRTNVTSKNVLTFEHYVNEIHTLSMSNSRMSISI